METYTKVNLEPQKAVKQIAKNSASCFQKVISVEVLSLTRIQSGKFLKLPQNMTMMFGGQFESLKRSKT